MGTLQVPNFKLRGIPYCGEDCERFMVEAFGKEWNLPPRSLLWQLFHPETVSQMMKGLQGMGLNPVSERVLVEDRVRWLNETLVREQLIVLWVCSKIRIPGAHVVVISNLKYNGGNCVMDDREGKLAHTPPLPIGNTIWSKGKLLSDWLPDPGGNMAAALFVRG